MVASSWFMRVPVTSKAKVEKWLEREAEGGYDLYVEQESVEVVFLSIDDAFRFRMQYDGELTVF